MAKQLTLLCCHHVTPFICPGKVRHHQCQIQGGNLLKSMSLGKPNRCMPASMCRAAGSSGSLAQFALVYGIEDWHQGVLFQQLHCLCSGAG